MLLLFNRIQSQMNHSTFGPSKTYCRTPLDRSNVSLFAQKHTISIAREGVQSSHPNLPFVFCKQEPGSIILYHSPSNIVHLR